MRSVVVLLVCLALNGCSLLLVEPHRPGKEVSDCTSSKAVPYIDGLAGLLLGVGAAASAVEDAQGAEPDEVSFSMLTAGLAAGALAYASVSGMGEERVNACRKFQDAEVAR